MRSNQSDETHRSCGDDKSISGLFDNTTFTSAANRKTAKALGLTIPDKLLALANEMIE